MASALILGLGLIVAAPVANAVTMPLTVYNDNGVATDFEAELEITSISGGLLLTFTNTSSLSENALGSAINQIYLESGFGDYFVSSSIYADAGTVNFVKDTVGPGTKPQDHTNVGTTGWSTTWSEGYFTRSGNKDDGINALGYDSADDSLTLLLAFDSGKSLTPEELRDLILTDTAFSVAVHVNACVDEPDESCNAYATPIPGAIWLLSSALLGLVGFGRWRRAVA